jgi:hypothetical protein
VEGEDAVEHGSQCINIGAFVDFLGQSLRLLRCHIARRAFDSANNCLIRVVMDDPHIVTIEEFGIGIGFFGRVQNLCQAPVHHHYLTELADHDVVGFQITVNDAPGMGERDGIADFLENGQQLRQAEALDDFVGVTPQSIQHGAQCGPLHHAHRVVDHARSRDPQFVERDDIGVLKLTGNPRFSDQPLHMFVGRVVAAQNDLQRHCASQVGIDRRDDCPHAPLGDNVADFVGALLLLLQIGGGKFGGQRFRVGQPVNQKVGYRFGAPSGRVFQGVTQLVEQRHRRFRRSRDNRFLFIFAHRNLMCGNRIHTKRSAAR